MHAETQTVFPVALLHSRLVADPTELAFMSGRPKYALPLLKTSRERPLLNSAASVSQSLKTYSNRPSYAPPIIPKYHPDGTGAARDSWINAHTADTRGNHLLSLQEKYWRAALGKPEYRGKCKSAVVDSRAVRTTRARVPLVPLVALPAPPHTVDSVGASIVKDHMLTRRSREKQTVECRAVCDALEAKYLH